MANSQFSIAVHVLTMLAKSGDVSLQSAHLAKSVNTNPVVVRRLLGILANNGLVISQKGAAGGTRLSRCADKINLAEVYRSLSRGEIFTLPTQSPNMDCPIGKNIEAVLCRLHKEIDSSVASKLAEYTITDLMEMVDAAKPLYSD